MANDKRRRAAAWQRHCHVCKRGGDRYSFRTIWAAWLKVAGFPAG